MIRAGNPDGAKLISAIVAADEESVIGKDGGLPWHLPSDLKRFKELTMGHPMIMGRLTHESIGRALPGRTNIVITSNSRYQAEGCIVAGSLDEGLRRAQDSPGAEEVFIIGGQSIFELAMPHIDRIYLTRIHAKVDGDKFFNFDINQWRTVSREEHAADGSDEYAYDFMVLERS